MHDNTNLKSLRPGPQALNSSAAQDLRNRSQSLTQTGKIVDWEAFHYGMLDHKFLNDPNPAKADHRRTIYELWVGELIDAVYEGGMQVYSKDGKLPRRLAAAQELRVRDSDILIGCLFDSEKLLQHMEAYFIKNKEL